MTTGILLAVAAGAINGLFALPMKAARGWAWENSWLPFSLLTLLVFPWIIALASVPALGAALAAVPAGHLVLAVVWGAAVYSGSLLFGISLAYIGTALGFALLVGSMSIVGVAIPIVFFNPETLRSAGGPWIGAGVALLLATLAFSFAAGRAKEQAQGGANTSGIGDTRRRSAFVGMLLALAGGTLSGLLSLGMNMRWATTISDAVVQVGGADPSQASNGVLALVLLGGMVPNVAYCLYQLRRNDTWGRYADAATRPYWLIILVMGVMYSGSVALWGISISDRMLGRLGPSVGWALFIGMMIVASNLGGFATGEWKGAGTRARGLMITGLAVMIAAMAAIGYGNYLIELH